MRRRRRNPLELNLDFCLDVITNMVGFMVLVAVMTVINSQNLSISLGSPILHDPPRGAEPLYFECREERLLYVDRVAIEGAAQALIERKRNAQGEKPPLDEWPALVAEADLGDPAYRLSVGVKGGSPVWSYLPRRSGLGESAEELRRPGSKFAAQVQALDKRRRYLYFIVRPDSFDVFQAARKVAREQGLETGWLPLEAGRRSSFGPQGTTPLPQ